MRFRVSERVSLVQSSLTSSQWTGNEVILMVRGEHKEMSNSTTMLDPVETLAHDVLRQTGALAPTVLGDDAPILTRQADQPLSFYFIAIVGGKDVGKTSLANAIAGVELARSTNVGEGTRTIICYAHQSQVEGLQDLLESIAPDRYEIRPHQHDSLRAQILVDLPDIDSVYDDHIELTRKFLRHTLYPIFIQSIEKYADARPQQLLKQVALGNDPSNFVFCLNKIDQLISRDGIAAARVVAADYAARLQKLLGLASLPRVHLVSAQSPEEFDLPVLRSAISKSKDSTTVSTSLKLARSRRNESIMSWMRDLNLHERALRSQRSLELARRSVDELLTEPLLAMVTPAIRANSSLRLSLADEASKKRIARWPLLGAIDLLVSPIFAIVRHNLGPSSPASVVRGAMDELKPDVDARITMLHARTLTDHPARTSISADDLSSRLANALKRRDELIVNRIARGHGAIFAPIRWLLTLGAAIWFPLAQPVAEAVLQLSQFSFDRATLLTIVRLISAEQLLGGLAFVVMWLIGLWALLRVASHRAVTRLLDAQDEARTDELDRIVVGFSDEMIAHEVSEAARAGDLAERFERLTSACGG